jgi:O-antigen/teichoic acid export membrane protein
VKGSLFNIARNTGATVLIRGGSGFARILLLLLVAKRFGPEDFGRLSLVLSLVEIVRVVADFGLDIVTIRRFSANKLLSERLLGNTLSLKLISASLGYIASIVVYWLLYHDMQGVKLAFIVGTSLATSLLLNAFVSYFQANLNMSSILISSLVSTLSYVSLTFFGFSHQWSLVSFAVIIPASELINLLITSSIYRRILSIKLRFDRRIIRSLIRESVPVAIGGIAVVLYLRLDNLLVGLFLNEASVGVYSAGYRFTEPFMLVFSSLSLSIYASLSRQGKNDMSNKVGQTMYRLLATVIGTSSVSALLLSFFAVQLLAMISPEYHNAVTVLRILSLSIVFKAVNAQLTAMINSRGRFSIITVIAIINLTINIGLNLLMIPKYGIIGAAIAVTTTEGVNTIMQLVCIKYYVKGLFREALP